MQAAGRSNLKRVTLELGGKSPFIIFDDVDGMLGEVHLQGEGSGRVLGLGSKGHYTELWDKCIQNFHLGRYIVGHTVGDLVLPRCRIGAVKLDFRPYIRCIPPQIKNLNMVIPILMHFCSFSLKLKHCKPHVIQLSVM